MKTIYVIIIAIVLLAFAGLLIQKYSPESSETATSTAQVIK